jgi:hypothetical protein
MEKTISFEALTLVSIITTKHLVRALLASGALDREQMKVLFDGAKAELHKSTLQIGPHEANDLFSMLWGDYISFAVEEKKQ